MALISEKEVNKMVEDSLEEIKQAVIADAKSSATWACKDAITSQVSETVSKFIEENVIPELLVSLEKKKSTIIKAALISAEEMAKALAEAMTNQLIENLGTSWDRKKIFQAMFE